MDELKLWLVTERGRLPAGELVRVVKDCLGAGLPAIQVREKDLPAMEMAALAGELRNLTRDSGAFLAVNDRVDVALAVGADGVQRTSTSLPITAIRSIAGAKLAIGASVHSVTEAVEAERDGADWITFGPVYDTPSKRRYGAPQGLERLREATRAVRIPVIAIGGITPERVSEIAGAGARGVAVISAILEAPSPADATRRFLAALR